jgi:BON domain
VRGGWVTLDGQVDYDFQRREVERMVRNLRGVQGVTTASLSRPGLPDQFEAQIERVLTSGRG